MAYARYKDPTIEGILRIHRRIQVLQAELKSAHKRGIPTQTIIRNLHDELVFAAEEIASGRSVAVQLYDLDRMVAVSLQEQAPNSQRMYRNRHT